MKKFDLMTLIALSVIAVALPIYGIRETVRLKVAQDDLLAQQVEEGGVVYVEVCAGCHGPDGAGLGVTPPLNHTGLRQANQDLLYRTIARAGHGTTMASWHLEEGGILNEYQIQALTDLIRFGDWERVEAQAIALNFEPPDLPGPEIEEPLMVTLDTEDPHSCIACHEEPTVHAGQFGTDCVRCHGLEAWQPAQLTRHIFPLDHGDEGIQTCQTCHGENYIEHTCYQCHDHELEEMESIHVLAEIPEFENCVSCHATALPGELERLKAPGIHLGPVEVNNLQPVVDQ